MSTKTEETFPWIFALGERLSYKKTGKGPPMICLHGWAGHEKTFDRILPWFNKNFTMYQMAWPGYGMQRLRRKWYSVEDMVRWVEEFRKKLSLGKPYIMGNCIGANIALEYAFMYPKNLSALILIEPHSFMPSYFNIFLYPVIGKSLIRFLFKTSVGYSLVKSLFPLEDKNKKTGYTEERLKKVPPHSMMAFLKSLKIYSRYTSMNRRYKITVPSYLVIPEKTFTQVEEFYKKYGRLFQNLTLIKIEDCVHNPIVECPDIFSKRVLSIIK